MSANTEKLIEGTAEEISEIYTGASCASERANARAETALRSLVDSVRRQALEDAVRVAESYRWTSSRWMPPAPQPGSQAIADAIRSLLSESAEGTRG